MEGRGLPGRSIFWLRLCSFTVDLVNAIGFPVQRLSDLGRCRGVVENGIFNHSQKDEGSGNHKQSAWLMWLSCPFSFSAWFKPAYSTTEGSSCQAICFWEMFSA